MRSRGSKRRRRRPGAGPRGGEARPQPFAFAERGLQSEELIADLKTIRKADLPALRGNCDRAWHWREIDALCP